MDLSIVFFTNAILLGIGLAMDAFSVSLANGMNEPCMKAKKIVLIATGENKADAIQGLLQGLVTEQLPCSVLRHHPDVTIYVDKAAYSKVKM